jgi:hypothetical protein
MLLNTFKNSGTITQVDYKSYTKKITFTFENGDHLIMNAFSECCSRSFFKEHSDYKFSSLVGQKIISLNQCFPNKTETHEHGDVTQTKNYKFKLENDSTFIFSLINVSNGWYTGWIEISGSENFGESDYNEETDPEGEKEQSKLALNPDAKPFIPKSRLNPDAKPFIPKSRLNPDAKPFIPKGS